MDDPWASPWADPASNPNTDSSARSLEPPKSQPESLLSPPPRAFFGGPSAAASPNVQSPWNDDDDDDFGKWNNSDQSTSKSFQLGWSPWADPPSQKGELNTRRDISSPKASPIPKPSSTATSPGLQPLPRSRASSVFRQLSPDPWAAETSSTNFKDTPPITPLDDRRPSTLSDFPCEPRQDAPETDKKTQKETVPSLSVPTDNSRPQGVKAAHNGIDNDVRDASPSRSSILSSVDVCRAVDRPETPITSNDDEPKPRARSTGRKASGKVQEIVGKYDGLARAASEEPPAPERRGTAWQKPGADVEPATDDESSVLWSNKNPDATLAFLAQPPLLEENENQLSPISAQMGKPDLLARITEEYGTVSFQPNPQAVDDLFIGPAAVNIEISGASHVPEHTIHDNFNEISERKTWYRISRYGSKRKHDSGQDENYQLVAWKTSQLHDETVKIVRRWMEEDSFTGRATLGKGRKGGLFNWNSPDAPVDLSTVFKRKTTQKPSTEPSKSTEPQLIKPSAASSISSAARDSTASRTSMSSIHDTSGQSTPLSSFAGSSAKVIPPSQPTHISGTPSKQSVTGGKVVPNKPPALRDFGADAANPKTNQGLKLHAEEQDDDDDDDIWGEMVTSQAVDEPQAPQAAYVRANNAPYSTAVAIETRPRENDDIKTDAKPEEFAIPAQKGQGDEFDEQELNAFEQKIISNLPDLSYMLK